MLNERYSRQVLFSPIGEKGQRKLNESTVLIAGAGALGSVISNHMVRSGVGKVKIIDRDFVEKSNLQRQMLYTEADAADTIPKAIAAQKKLSAFNDDVKVEGIVTNISTDNIDSLMEGVDLVLDGTDNFSTRYLLNDFCYQAGIPFSYAGVISSRGMTGLFIPGETPCLRCMVPPDQEALDTCDIVGVISPIVDIIASMQSTEAIKYLTDNHQALSGKLQTLDVWQNQSFSIKLNTVNPDCPTCQAKQFPSLQKKAQSEETTMCGRETVQIHRLNSLNLEEWEIRLSKITEVKRTPFLLKAEMDKKKRLVLFTDGRVLIQGTDNVDEARTLYDRYIGS